MADLRYRVILEPEDEGGYNVVIPAFPNGHTCGDTVAECLAHAREVIELEIAYRSGPMREQLRVQVPRVHSRNHG